MLGHLPVTTVEHMLESLPSGAVFYRGDAIYLNSMAESITGYVNGELKTLEDWHRRIFRDQKEMFDRLRRVLYQDQQPLTGEIVPIAHKSGREVWVEYAVQPLEDAAFCLMRDMTAYWEREVQLERQIRDLREELDNKAAEVERLMNWVLKLRLQAKQGRLGPKELAEIIEKDLPVIPSEEERSTTIDSRDIHLPLQVIQSTVSAMEKLPPGEHDELNNHLAYLKKSVQRIIDRLER